jgi:hypothetical protein
MLAPRGEGAPTPARLAFVRERSSLAALDNAVAKRFRWELGSGAPLLPSAPAAFLRKRVGFVANFPTEARASAAAVERDGVSVFDLRDPLLLSRLDCMNHSAGT